MAASPVIAPEEEIVFEKKTLKVREPKLTAKAVSRKQRVKDTLAKLFEGREEFLGWTPD